MRNLFDYATIQQANTTLGNRDFHWGHDEHTHITIAYGHDLAGTDGRSYFIADDFNERVLGMGQPAETTQTEGQFECLCQWRTSDPSRNRRRASLANHASSQLGLVHSHRQNRTDLRRRTDFYYCPTP